MDWLTQNWTYLLLFLGVFLLMRFSGMGCGMGGRRAEPGHRHEAEPAKDEAVTATPTTDPVSLRPVDPASAVATVYQGRAYYFESRENRERFEAAPEQYASAKNTATVDDSHKGKHGHGGGCC